MRSLHNKTEVVTNSAAETESFAENFAKRLKKHDIVAFIGGLGAGKTAFTRGLARGLGYSGQVSSPTFTVVNEYLPDDGMPRGLPLYHFDMYRITSESDLESIGFFDYDDGICAIEWFENIAGFDILPNYIIEIETLSENSRKITVKSY
jgi:tRNA threonylcarbamoyladenosine biosynthesis protein TsaE